MKSGMLAGESAFSVLTAAGFPSLDAEERLVCRNERMGSFFG